MLRMPVAISKTMPPTMKISEIRSSRWAADRTGGQANSLGMTDHSLASTSGTRTRPRHTCRPSVSWNSHTGRVGQSK
jgi:hypothetical protein